MGLRYRKSVKLAPGVKLNIGKKSTGISVGVKGARFSVNSKGRVTRSVGIPGTGISYTKSTSLKSKKKQSRSKKKTSKLQAFLNSAIPDEAKDNSNSISAPVSNTTENTESTSDEITSSIESNSAPKKKKRKIGCLIPIIIILIIFAIPSKHADVISISADVTTFDIHDEPEELTVSVEPDNATKSDIKFSTTNKTVAEITGSSDDYKITLNGAEGETVIKASNSKDVVSNELVITVVDNERIEREAEEKKKAEEAAAKAEEEKRLAEEAAAKEAEQKQQAEAAAKAAEQEQQAKAAAQASSQQTNETTVYVSGNGKKYHRNPNCSNMSSPKAITLSQAESSGYTPCKKCY